MIAPRYIPTNLQTVHQEQDFTKHQKKLAQIQSDDRKKKVVDKEGPAKAKLVETREKNLKFHNSEKLIAIEKDNEILLGRLVEISRKKKTDLAPLSKSTTLPKTLNGPSRQREKDRIALENEAFAKRLLSQQPLFNRKKLELDYGKHISLVKQMKRLENGSTRKVKLPPLKDLKTNPTEDEREDLAEEEEKREKEEKEKKEREEKERIAKEEKEKLEKEEKEKLEREEKEKKEKEEKEKHEREEKEKKEREEKERIAKEEKEKLEKEEKERKEKEEKERKEKEEKDKAAAKTPAELEAEKQAKEKEDKKWDKLDEKDGDNPMLGMMRGMVPK